jgi:hypothetical protein
VVIRNANGGLAPRVVTGVCSAVFRTPLILANLRRFATHLAGQVGQDLSNLCGKMREPSPGSAMGGASRPRLGMGECRVGDRPAVGPVVAKLLPAAIWAADFPDNQESRLSKLPDVATDRFRES